jgi:type VI secretion system protein ImpE
VPTRYPDTPLAGGDALALARRTEWRETSSGAWVGLGQRVITTDTQELALMDLRTITLN